MVFLSFSLAKYFSDYIDYDKKNNVPPVFFIHTKCVFFKPHNNNLNKYMILKTSCPRTALISSYTKPVLYKSRILLNGKVVMKFV